MLLIGGVSFHIQGICRGMLVYAAYTKIHETTEFIICLSILYFLTIMAGKHGGMNFFFVNSKVFFKIKAHHVAVTRIVFTLQYQT